MLRPTPLILTIIAAILSAPIALAETAPPREATGDAAADAQNQIRVDEPISVDRFAALLKERAKTYDRPLLPVLDHRAGIAYVRAMLGLTTVPPAHASEPYNPHEFTLPEDFNRKDIALEPGSDDLTYARKALDLLYLDPDATAARRLPDDIRHRLLLDAARMLHFASRRVRILPPPQARAIAQRQSAEQKTRLIALVNQLADPDYETREQAFTALQKSIEQALPQLVAALESPDVEVRSRAETLIARYLDQQARRLATPIYNRISEVPAADRSSTQKTLGRDAANFLLVLLEGSNLTDEEAALRDRIVDSDLGDSLEALKQQIRGLGEQLRDAANRGDQQAIEAVRKQLMDLAQKYKAAQERQAERERQQAQRSQRQALLNELQARQNDLVQQLRQIQAQRDALQAQREKLQEHLKQLTQATDPADTRRVDKIKAHLAELNAAIEQTNTTIATLEQAINEVEARITTTREAND